MNRFRPVILLFFTSILTALIFFGAQLKVPTAFAFQGGAGSFNPANPTANTCAGCHSGTASSGGSTSISGFPAGLTYTPGGAAIPLTVTVTDPNFSTHGFQLSARLASNLANEEGTFLPGSSSNIGSGGAVQGSGSSSTFAFTWTPPTTAVGNVAFYLTGLATNSIGSNAPYTALYTLTPAVVTPPPATLSATPASLSFAFQLGGTTPAAQNITVSSSGAALSFTTAAATTAGGAWLSATPASGSTTSGTVSVSVNPAGLAAGTYNGTVTTTSTGATGSPKVSTVSLVVSAATTPTLNATPGSMSFAFQTGGATPPVQNITVTSSGAALSFTSAVATTSGGTWLVATPASGSTTSGIVGVSVNPTGLAAGTYNGTVTITSAGATGSPKVTSVSLVVSAVATPVLSASPATMSFTYQTGGVTPAAQPILVTSSSTALSFTASSVGTWISATPTSGTTPGSVNVSVNPAGLVAGTYSGTVTITSVGATGSPKITNVTLVVSAPTGNSSLTVAPTSLQFNFQSGGSMPPSQKLTLTTTGAALTYTASSSGGPWLSSSPGGGTTPGTSTISVNPANMSAGSYSGMVHLSTPGGNSSNVPVTLNITSRRGCGEGCGGTSRAMYAVPFVLDPSSSNTLTSAWVDLLGMPTGSPSSPGNPGLVLSKNATAPTGSQAGAHILNVQGSLTELGYDYREGGQCTATSPRFLVVTTDTVMHVVGGCSKGTITAAPSLGWKRVRFNLTDSSVQSSPVILPGDMVSSITLVMDLGPEAGPTAAGGLVVIDAIDINGTLVGKGSSASTSRDD